MDDVIIVPLGILIVVKLIPPEIMAEHRALGAATQGRPMSHTAAIVITIVWTAMYRTCRMDLLSLFRELSSRLDQWPPERGAVRSIKIMI
jgi:hypothetical protein